MSNVMFIKPALETDATWEMVRTSSYLGIWYLASLLKEKGHNVMYLDEVVRNGGLGRSVLFQTKLKGSELSRYQIDISLEDYRKEKNRFFEQNTPGEFTKKYTAFKGDEIVRTIARTGNSLEDTLSKVEAFAPEYVCVPLIASTNYRTAVMLGKSIKKSFPGIKMIYGGQHISACWEDFLKENDWVDHLITGDAIAVIDSLVKGKISDRVIHGEFQSMKQFPLLDYSIIADTNYPIDQAYSYPSFGRKSTDFMFSKGCFRKCDFCVAGSQKGNYTSYLDWDLIDEQFKVFKESGIEEIIVQDDAFIYKKDNLLKKLGLLNKYGFYWQIAGGFDFETLNTSVTDLLVDFNKTSSGKLTGLYMPFNPRSWNKGKSATGTMVNRYENNFECMKRLREEADVYVFTSDILGTPEHTAEIVENDMEIHKQMIKDGYLDAALTLSATMLPGTSWFNANKHNVVNVYDYSGYSLFATHHRTKNIPDPSKIEELVVKRTKELNSIQDTYNWQTAFPNSVWPYKG